MEQQTIYLKAERKAEVSPGKVRIQDLAAVACSDRELAKKAGSLVAEDDFTKNDGRIVITVLRMIETITSHYPQVRVESLGAAETLVVLDREDRHNKVRETLLIIFVSLVCFFGTAFTIMAFHNDIGITDLFDSVYEMITGKAAGGVTILEISYSVGLAAGITIFFNHIGGRRLTKDPTPVEVEMRLYENDVNTALVESCGRKGRAGDVE